jgi:hypothetical protein
LSDSWEITFCSNPHRLCDAKICAKFSRRPDTVNDERVSGIYTVVGFPQNGKWVQRGELVQFFASYNSGKFFISFVGTMTGADRMGGIAFVDAGDNIENTGTWYAEKLTTRCMISSAKSIESPRLMSGAADQ